MSRKDASGVLRCTPRMVQSCGPMTNPTYESSCVPRSDLICWPFCAPRTDHSCALHYVLNMDLCYDSNTYPSSVSSSAPRTFPSCATKMFPDVLSDVHPTHTQLCTQLYTPNRLQLFPRRDPYFAPSCTSRMLSCPRIRRNSYGTKRPVAELILSRFRLRLA